MNVLKKALIASPILSMSGVLGLGVSTAFAAITANTLNSPVQNATDIGNLLCNIISWFIWFVIIISVLMAVFAAYEYATAGDDTEKTAKGRKTLTYAAIGVLIALIATGVPAIVVSLLGETAPFGGCIAL
ncbi:MAG TPA: hypothetical protein VMA75_04845 [Candidatus Paceibacterota bacterium]|nr:hypothetical protein [Candidatus Paceibacterota bacterium]